MAKQPKNSHNPTGKLTKEERVKTASILHAIEIESAFKLYAYRVVSHENFITRVAELIQLYTKTVKEDTTEFHTKVPF
jgi:hypothetical protein